MRPFNSVLCPIDFSGISLRALAYAATLARGYDAHLEVLHVVPALDPSTRDETLAAVERAMAAAGAPAAKSKAVIEAGRADEVIAARASRMPADLLVMGTHGRSGFNRLFLGSITEKVLHQVTCPVLTVPPAADTGEPLHSFKTIVCAVDYSRSALKALEYALDLGRQAKGKVTVLSALECMDPDDVLESSIFDPHHEALEDSRRRRQALIDAASGRLHALVAEEPSTWCEIAEVVAADRAYKATLRLARELNADLIVMGAQGTSGLELMVYGSNTQHVLRAAACPVLTVRA